MSLYCQPNDQDLKKQNICYVSKCIKTDVNLYKGPDRYMFGLLECQPETSIFTNNNSDFLKHLCMYTKRS